MCSIRTSCFSPLNFTSLGHRTLSDVRNALDSTNVGPGKRFEKYISIYIYKERKIDKFQRRTLVTKKNKPKTLKGKERGKRQSFVKLEGQEDPIARIQTEILHELLTCNELEKLRQSVRQNVKNV